MKRQYVQPEFESIELTSFEDFLAASAFINDDMVDDDNANEY